MFLVGGELQLCSNVCVINGRCVTNHSVTLPAANQGDLRFSGVIAVKTLVNTLFSALGYFLRQARLAEFFTRNSGVNGYVQ